MSPHNIAVASGSLDFYKHVVERTENRNPNEPYADLTPMHFAAIFGEFEICQYIITNLDVKNPENKLSVTPLHNAAYYGHLNICKMIIDSVEEKNPKDINGYTPFHAAAEGGYLDNYHE